jgi:hypothetical protein
MTPVKKRIRTFLYFTEFLHSNPLSETLLSCTNLYVKPVFLRCEGAGIFFIVGAEWVMSPIKIYQYVPPGHWFNIKITTLDVGLGL